MTSSDQIDASPATPNEAAAAAVHAVKVYGEGERAVRALDDVTVSFDAGRFTAVMGPSGSGKSTLLNCMAGLDRLSSGSASIGSTDLAGLSDKQLTLLRRTKVGFIFQGYNLLPALTVRENITYPLDLDGRRPDADRFDELLAMLGISDKLDALPSQLSGGQQQRVAVARALVAEPGIVFADEPTGALDSKSSSTMLEHLRRAADVFGQTVLMVTHDPHAAAHTHRVVFMADGRLDGDLLAPTADAVLDRMRSLGDDLVRRAVADSGKTS